VAEAEGNGDGDAEAAAGRSPLGCRRIGALIGARKEEGLPPAVTVVPGPPAALALARATLSSIRSRSVMPSTRMDFSRCCCCWGDSAAGRPPSRLLAGLRRRLGDAPEDRSAAAGLAAARRVSADCWVFRRTTPITWPWLLLPPPLLNDCATPRFEVLESDMDGRGLAATCATFVLWPSDSETIGTGMDEAEGLPG